jgi:GTP cyclohydrolase II
MSDPLTSLFAAIPSPSIESASPYTTLSFAQSLDGSIAVRADQALQLSGPEAMEMTHRLRGAHDAIMVGVNTILADNPQLTTRYGGGEHARPLILDSTLRTPPDARIFEHPKNPIFVCGDNPPHTARKLLEEAGGEILNAQQNNAGQIDLRPMMADLKARGIKSLMVEGGASVISSMLDAKVVDACVITIAPFFVGGVKAVLNPINPPARIETPHWEKLGRDMILWGQISWELA